MQEIWFLHLACHLMLIDIYLKFHVDSLKGFQVIEQTLFCDRVQRKSQKVQEATIRSPQ